MCHGGPGGPDSPNIQHPTSNVQHPMAQAWSGGVSFIGCSMLGVGCWMFCLSALCQDVLPLMAPQDRRVAGLGVGLRVIEGVVEAPAFLAEQGAVHDEAGDGGEV